jgi:hypothetical protein
VVTGVVMVLTALIILLVPFTLPATGTGKTFAAPTTPNELRWLLGAGYLGGLYVAPILGVLCITTEYRHKVLTTSLLITPRREQVLLAKAVACVLWGFLMCLASFVVVAAMGIPWLVAEGGSVSALLHQTGAVVPTLFLAFALLSLYGLGIGILLRNQIAAVLITLGFTVIIEQILVALFQHLLHTSLNWLPSEATRALVGGLRGNGGNDVQLLSWWAGGLVLLAWGVVPGVIGYFTTFRRDVT